MSTLSPSNLSVDLSIGHLILPVSVAFHSPESMAAATPLYIAPPERVRYTDIDPYEGAPSSTYLRAVETLSGSLMRHNAVLIELRSEDAAIIRCGLEASRLYFRTRTQNPGKGGRAHYCYRAGRPSEDWDSSPPCLDDVFKCMGKVARAALSAIARHLRLRSDVFNHLLDDNPLPTNQTSASMLVVSYSAPSGQTSKSAAGVGKPHVNVEVEKGLLTLISSDYPGLQVCDPNNHWYLADGGSAPGDLLILTGKCLSHATAGLRHAASYRSSFDQFSGGGGGGNGRTSLEFRLMPQGDAILDCSPISSAGHVIPQSYVPISVSRFLDDLSAEEDVTCNLSENTEGIQKHLNREISLRSILSDPLSGAFLEDAMVVTCGHSFGGLMLRKVLDSSRCTICDVEIESNTLIPNHALRAAAVAVRHEDDRRLFHNAAIRKRRKEMSDSMVFSRRPNQEDAAIGSDDGLQKKVSYPFVVKEKVLIKGNKRTPDKFVGKEAIITSQCLNGWYLLKIVDSGEDVRLQYRSLKKLPHLQDTDPRLPS